MDEKRILQGKSSEAIDINNKINYEFNIQGRGILSILDVILN